MREVPFICYKCIYIQEGHNGPEIAHLYKGPWGVANFNQWAFLTNLVDTH
jgi:hypothetical protein